MRVPRRLLLVSIIAFVIVGLCSLYVYVPRARERRLRVQEQQALAQQLGVEITDYPPADLFPAGYFSAMLKSGASVEEVHRIVQEYELALVCQDYAEVYYFFSKEDSEALRIKLFYDNEKRFDFLSGEDDDSMTIYTGDCSPGQLSK